MYLSNLKIKFVQLEKCIFSKPHLAHSQVCCTLHTLQSPHWIQCHWKRSLRKSVSRIILKQPNIASTSRVTEQKPSVLGDGRGEGGRQCHLNDQDQQNRVSIKLKIWKLKLFLPCKNPGGWETTPTQQFEALERGSGWSPGLQLTLTRTMLNSCRWFSSFTSSICTILWKLDKTQIQISVFIISPNQNSQSTCTQGGELHERGSLQPTPWLCHERKSSGSCECLKIMISSFFQLIYILKISCFSW